MLSFFDFVADFFYNLGSIITNLFKSLLLAIATITQSSSLILQFSVLLPGILGASVVVVVSIVIIKFIVGR